MKSICLIFLFLLAFFSASAQIIYTDIVPDDTIAFGQPFNLDLNNDGSIDFIFHVNQVALPCSSCGSSYQWHLPMVSPTFSNELLEGNPSWVNPLNSNDSISSQSQSWSTDSNLVLQTTALLCTTLTMPCIPTWYAPWGYNSEKYVGLRILVGTNYHYGWARIYHGTIIKDYAFNNTNDSIIFAGSIPVKINELAYYPNDINIFPNPARSNENITVNYLYQSYKIEIYNYLGSLVYVKQIYNQESPAINQTFLSGIYLVRISSGNHTVTKILVIQ